jgi:hypothetical protein
VKLNVNLTLKNLLCWNCRLNLADKCYDSVVKNQFLLKLTAATVLSAQLFGCAVSTKTTQSRAPVVVTTPPAAPPAPVVSQEAALDKNEVIIDKPAPVQTEVATLLARITPAQSARIAQAVKEGNTDPKAVSNINQATPKMRAFIERLSCIRQYNDGGSATLQALAAPNASFKFFVPPMHGTKVHNKTTCLTVTSVQLKLVTLQGALAIQIKVSYIAEDSGETTTSNHEINKNSKGLWWFTR